MWSRPIVSTGKVEARGSGVQGQPELLIKDTVSQQTCELNKNHLPFLGTFFLCAFFIITEVLSINEGNLLKKSLLGQRLWLGALNSIQCVLLPHRALSL